MALVTLPKGYDKIPRSGIDRVWSVEQDAIFEWFARGRGNLVVRARAGTGKTTTLLEGADRAPERRVLLAAFNKAIAEELSARVQSSNVRVQTLHSLGLSFCRRRLSDLQVDTKGERARALAKCAMEKIVAGRKVRVGYDAVSAIAGLHTKIREILVDPRAETARADEIERELAAVENREPANLFAQLSDWLQTFAVGFGYDVICEEGSFWTLSNVVEAALLAVDFAKEETRTIDFADMIFLPLVHGWVAPVCDLMVVDEAQDMSAAQLRLAIAATKLSEQGGRICVVGDDLQAIYAFRGADSGSLDRLKVELDARELGLKTTYRCPRAVVELARSFAPDFCAADAAPAGEVKTLKSRDEIAKLAQPGDFVLSRVNAPLVGVCIDLIRAGKRAFVKGAEIGRSLNQLLDKLESASRCGTLKDLTKALAKWHAAEVKKVGKAATHAVQDRLARLSEQRELIEAFVEGSKSYADLRVKVAATFADVDKPDAIVCSTVHKVKGLEAPRVFLLGRTFNRATAEESNICYVAATRAKETLYLVGKTKREFTRCVEDTLLHEIDLGNEYLLLLL